METIDLKKVAKFYPDRISREMLKDSPEMRIALMCLNPGQKLDRTRRRFGCSCT